MTATQPQITPWSVPRIWEGETCFILAGGPSLCGHLPLERFQRVITINTSWRLRPDGLHYFCDNAWWDRESTLLETVTGRNIGGMFWVKGGEPPTDPRVKWLPFSGQIGLETNPSYLKHGSNSGYQCLNLAFHLGVKRIVLLGYDMRVQGDKTHWHQGHGHSPAYYDGILKNELLPLFQFIVEPLKQAGVEVINATPGSALECFPKRDLTDILNEL